LIGVAAMGHKLPLTGDCYWVGFRTKSEDSEERMSKLRCPCGHVISDNTDDLPYKAQVTPDANRSALFAGFEDALRGLLEVKTDADRERWLARFGFNRMYPRDLSVVDMALDLLGSRAVALSKDCYECTQCGRLHVQRSGSTNMFRTFTPDSGSYEGLLRPDGEGKAAG
jgi:hypothetical protein